MTIELPDAAWYATEVMGWQLVEYCRDPHEGDGILWHWVDQRGRHAAHEIGWDPLTNDADALQLWDTMPRPRVLETYEQFSYAGVLCLRVRGGWIRGRGADIQEAICHAVHDWWLAQREEEAHG